ncbi:MAG TPA: LysR substrate-binding domain-containing protein, partial [Steroidobacteraceae bacterium]|nr:LysR substrate-binding domain-containing protein [Steroidobacteraceae bacterium]
MNMLPVFGTRAFPDGLRVVDVRPVQWVCAVSPDHPTVHDELTEEQFRTLPHLIGWPNSHSVPLEEFSRRLFNADINVRATVQSLVEIPFLLQGTNLITALPERLASKLSELAPLKMFPLPLRMPEIREVLVWHKRNEPDPGHAWLRDMLLEVAREP